uniref:Uncharacterized protein n=1 Tax=viral metagenome TaxID=1070528 RepID=A0A6M3IW35_9ZZZZ
MSEEKMSPQSCMDAGKCLMADMMNKMKTMPPKDEYDKLSEDEKDKIDEKDVMDKEKKEE